MRKIKSRERKARDDKIKGFIVSIVLILILFLSIIGYAFFSRDDGDSIILNEEVEYNGIIFTQKTGYWYTEIGGYEFITKYTPLNIQDISVDSGISLSNYSNQPLYFVSDNQESVNEIIRNIGRFTTRYQYACLEGEECEGNLPIKTCSDNVIIIEEALENKVYQEEKCIFVKAIENEEIRVSDSLIFKLLGII